MPHVAIKGPASLPQAVKLLLSADSPSCHLQVYNQSESGSQVVNTAWAMLALMAAGQQEDDAKPLHRAARCLLAAQLPSGDWPQQGISGVFNRNCMITYSNYRCLLGPAPLQSGSTELDDLLEV